jgi:hypothetical protein
MWRPRARFVAFYTLEAKQGTFTIRKACNTEIARVPRGKIGLQSYCSCWGFLGAVGQRKWTRLAMSIVSLRQESNVIRQIIEYNSRVLPGRDYSPDPVLRGCIFVR